MNNELDSQFLCSTLQI